MKFIEEMVQKTTLWFNSVAMPEGLKNAALIILSILIIGVTLIVLRYLLYCCIYGLAKLDILFTLPPQNEIVTIMNGKLAHKRIGRIRGKLIDAKTGKIIPYNTAKEIQLAHADPENNYREARRLPWGIFWIGLPPAKTIYEYKLSWLQFKEVIETKGDNKKAKYDFVPREANVRSVVWTYNYGIVINEAESSEAIEMSIKLVVRVEALDVHKMLFGTRDWHSELTATVVSVFTEWVSQSEFAEVLNTPREFLETKGEPTTPTAVSPGSLPADPPQKKPIESTIVKLRNAINKGDEGNTLGNPGIESRLGITVTTINIQEVTFSGAKGEAIAHEIAQANLAKTLGTRRLEAATFDATITRTKGDAENAVLEKRMQILGPNAQVSFLAQATQNATTVVLGDGAMQLVQQVPTGGHQPPKQPTTSGKTTTGGTP